MKEGEGEVEKVVEKGEGVVVVVIVVDVVVGEKEGEELQVEARSVVGVG